jgi:hypothetical protein
VGGNHAAKAVGGTNYVNKFDLDPCSITLGRTPPGMMEKGRMHGINKPKKTTGEGVKSSKDTPPCARRT